LSDKRHQEAQEMMAHRYRKSITIH